MNLTRDSWTKKDIDEFQIYLKSFSKGEEKAKWEQRIVNTQLPCIAVPSPIVRDIARKISKGNFMEFLDLWPYENFTNTTIIGYLICQIKDWNTFEKYLSKYANMADNWATCDTLKFKIKEDNKEQFFQLSRKYIRSGKPFVRRIGIIILFKLVSDDKYIDKILNTLNLFENESEYYVNMVNAWLFCECFIKQREKTVEFLKTNKMNKFTTNKGISKCRDSFRVSTEDKEMLLKYRK